jgi:hypothetical protein
VLNVEGRSFRNERAGETQNDGGQSTAALIVSCQYDETRQTHELAHIAMGLKKTKQKKTKKNKKN